MGIGRAFVQASLVGKRLHEGCGFGVLVDVEMDGEREREEWRGYGVVKYKFLVRERQGEGLWLDVVGVVGVRGDWDHLLE